MPSVPVSRKIAVSTASRADERGGRVRLRERGDETRARRRHEFAAALVESHVETRETTERAGRGHGHLPVLALDESGAGADRSDEEFVDAEVFEREARPH